MVTILSALAALALTAVHPQPLSSTPRRFSRYSDEQSISLATAITRAKENDSELRFLRERYALERFHLAEQYRRVLPRVHLSYTHSDTVQYGGPDNRSRRLAFGVEQLLYDGGRTRRAFRIARIDRELRRITTEQRKRALKTEVTRAYLHVLGLARRVELSRQNLEIGLGQLQVAEQEYLLGRMTNLSLTEVRLAVQEQELAVRQLTVQHAAARRTLSRLIHAPGARESQELKPRGSLDLGYTGSMSRDSLNRYVVEAARSSEGYEEHTARIARALTQEQIARRGVLPRLTADGELSVSGREFPLDEPAFSVGLRVELIPAYSGASLQSSAGSPRPETRSRTASLAVTPVERLDRLYHTGQARNDRLRAEAEFARFDAATVDDISRQLGEIEALRDHAAVLRERIAAKRERMTVVSTQVELGERPRLDVLRAVSELNELENTLADLVVSLFERELALMDAIGADGDPQIDAIVPEPVQ